MGLNWFQVARRFALRKNTLRVDLRIYPQAPVSATNANDIERTVTSMLTAAIANGLDVVGLVSMGDSDMGWTAYNIIQRDRLDIWAIPGQEYRTSDGYQLVAYFMKEPLPTGMAYDQIVHFVKSKRGFVMVIKLGKRQAAHVNSIRGTDKAPNAVEIYNAEDGGFSDVEVDYPKFVSSASRTPEDVEKTNVFTLIERDDFEKLGLLPEDYGVDYKPTYLLPDSQEHQRAQMQMPSGLGQSASKPTATPGLI